MQVQVAGFDIDGDHCITYLNAFDWLRAGSSVYGSSSNETGPEDIVSCGDTVSGDLPCPNERLDTFDDAVPNIESYSKSEEDQVAFKLILCERMFIAFAARAAWPKSELSFESMLSRLPSTSK